MRSCASEFWQGMRRLPGSGNKFFGLGGGFAARILGDKLLECFLRGSVLFQFPLAFGDAEQNVRRSVHAWKSLDQPLVCAQRALVVMQRELRTSDPVICVGNMHRVRVFVDKFLECCNCIRKFPVPEQAVSDLKGAIFYSWIKRIGGSICCKQNRK